MSDSTVLLFWIIFAIIGGAFGMTKNYALVGILLGVFLGPLGIVFHRLARLRSLADSSVGSFSA